MNELVKEKIIKAWPENCSQIDFDKLVILKVHPENINNLERTYNFKIVLQGENNFIVLDELTQKFQKNIFINFTGSNNILYIGANSALEGSLLFGNNSLAIINNEQYNLNLDVNLYNSSVLFWGKKSRTYGCRIWIEGGKSVIIGDDCLFSELITIRTSDHHSIIDISEKKHINHAADIIIGNHVWIGPEVSILKGIKIGNQAIVGLRTIVTRDIPSNELHVGSPNKCIRKNVSWLDSHSPTQDEINCLIDQIERKDVS